MSNRIVRVEVYRVNNTPWINAKIQFNLMASSYVGVRQYPIQSFVTRTGLLGASEITLWCNTEGYLNTHYQCVLPDGVSFDFVLTPGNPITLGELRSTATPIEEVNQNLLDFIIAEIEERVSTGEIDPEVIDLAVSFALSQSTTILKAANNLSDVASISTARNNLELGSAATSSISYLVDRSIHTGTQSISSIVNLQSILDSKKSIASFDTFASALATDFNTLSLSVTSISNALTLKANQIALDSLTTTVNGHTSALTNKANLADFQALSGTVTGINLALESKATLTALDSLSTVVTNLGLAIALKADQTSLTALQTTVAAKADQSSLSTLQNTVTINATKLATIATGATANSTDAQLRDRSTHTGTIAQNVVSGLVAALNLKASRKSEILPIELFSHFLGSTSDGWASTALGSGSTITYNTGTADLLSMGVARLQAGTTATGKLFLTTAVQSATSTKTLRLVQSLGNAVYYVKQRLLFLADSTENFLIRLGFFDNISSDPAIGVYFKYSTASLNWQAVLTDSVGDTIVDTGVLADLNTWLDFRIFIKSDGTQALFYINGNLVYTDTSSKIPISKQLGAGCGIAKLAGTTNRTFEIDLQYVGANLPD